MIRYRTVGLCTLNVYLFKYKGTGLFIIIYLIQTFNVKFKNRPKISRI